MSNERTYYYIYDKRLVEVSKNIPNIGNRALVVQSLIASYNLVTGCKICSSEEATDDELLLFHSTDYVDFLKRIHGSSDLEKLTDSEETGDFNLGYDCPLFENMYDFAKLIAGSTLTAVKKLMSQHLQVKRKLKCIEFDNSQPRSYLKMKNQLNRVKKIVDFDIPANLTLEEDCTMEDFKNDNKKEENVDKLVYETEVSFSPSDSQQIAINWFGGWHHAQRDEAGGFCYVNDIVIAIQYLLKFCNRVLYIDFDIHHGNGVENAFYFTSKVLTLSLHKYEPGFYPATGSLEDVGEGKGKYYTVNVPLKSGITDEKYVKVFEPVFEKIMKKYQTQCVVVQCGADSMPCDPLGGFNLTPVGLGRCLKTVLDKKLPTLILGGGGYNIVNTSKCWTYLTSVILNRPISNDIPEHSFLHLYGPEFELAVSESLRKDENDQQHLDHVLAKVLENLDNLPEPR